MNLLSLFSGIGGFEKGLDKAGVKYNLIGFSEIDEPAVNSYCAVHDVDKTLNLGDVSKITKEDIQDKVDIITHGSPCQSFSLAGKGHGGDFGSGTRSSLMWETVRLVKELSPNYVVWENVKAVLNKTHKHNFDLYTRALDELGYNNYYKVLNAKDFGIPQSRERIFVVSIKKEIDDSSFEFPEPIELQLFLEDLAHFRPEDDLTENFVARYNLVNETNINRVEFMDYVKDLPITRGIGTKKLKLYNFNEMDTVTTINGITGTLTTRNVQNYNKKYEVVEGVEKPGLYKPSPLMAWRLMGFSDEDFNKASKVSDEVELYNQAGNSIVVDVVAHIFKKLFK